MLLTLSCDTGSSTNILILVLSNNQWKNHYYLLIDRAKNKKHKEKVQKANVLYIYINDITRFVAVQSYKWYIVTFICRVRIKERREDEGQEWQ